LRRGEGAVVAHGNVVRDAGFAIEATPCQVDLEGILKIVMQLNHTIVATRHKEASATFLTQHLGLPSRLLLGPFAVVRVGGRYHRATSGARETTGESR